MDRRLPNGKYKTVAGSTMEISGKHGGISKVDFDWLEEGACCDCEPMEYEQDGRLVWHCEHHAGGSAELIIMQDDPLPENAEIPTLAEMRTFLNQ